MSAPASGDEPADAFGRLFGTQPEVEAAAPGRVNLLGEHTDYNEGYVLPVALPCLTRVWAARADGIVEAYAEVFGELGRRPTGAAPEGTWLDYVVGCVAALDRAGFPVPGVRAYIARGVPLGAGLASSAALEVAVLRALRALYALPVDDLRLALLAHQAEVEYVGVRCGVMDQVVASSGRVGEALFLDTRRLRSMSVPVPPGGRIVVIDSALPRRLSEAAYNQRRTECEEAARRLGVAALRDLTPEALPHLVALPEPLGRRARHVITENARVLQGVRALQAGELAHFGRLMLDSHRSLRDDYEVSVPELDRLVDAAMAGGAFGARLTGAGFGGCVVALVPQAPAAADQGFEEALGRAVPTARIRVALSATAPASAPRQR
jgi:galactokinase